MNPTLVDSFVGRRINFIPSNSNLDQSLSREDSDLSVQSFDIMENQSESKEEIPPLSDNDIDEEVNESTTENSGHAEDLIKLCASIPLPSQAKETSNKPPQTGNSSVKVKRIKRKKD